MIHHSSEEFLCVYVFRIKLQVYISVIISLDTFMVAVTCSTIDVHSRVLYTNTIPNTIDVHRRDGFSAMHDVLHLDSSPDPALYWPLKVYVDLSSLTLSSRLKISHTFI